MKILSIVFMLLGVYVGAGIASGQEVAIYFSRYGFLSIPIAIITGFAFVFFVMWMYNLSTKYNAKSINEFNNYVFPKYKNMLNIFYGVALIIIISAMLSSNMEISKIIFNKSSIIMQLITIMLLFVVLQGGVNRISKVSNILVPFVVLFIIILFALTIKTFSINVVKLSVNMFSCTMCCINYYFLNILFVSMFVFTVSHKYTHKQMLVGATISGVVITILLILISLLIVFTNSLNVDLPIINIAFKCGNIWGCCSIIVVWISLFTTLILNTYALINQTFFIKNRLLKFVLIMLIASLISLIKFSIIVQWVYLIISTFSIVYFCCVYYATKPNKLVKMCHTKNAVSLH